MARIRTIKPEFFRHEGLQDAEIANPGAYAMLVFAGLWGHCDSKGRFEWRPRQLKLDILPFLPFDMEKTLTILHDGGFVRRYSADGKTYGEIPSFENHQRITGKEATDGERHPRNNGETTGKQRGNTQSFTNVQEKEKEKEVNPLSESSAFGSSPASAREPATAARVAMACRQLGYANAAPGDARLVALLAAGLTPGEIIAAAEEHRDSGRSFRWVLGCAEGRRRDAAVDPLPIARSPPARAPHRQTSGRQAAIDNYARQAAEARGDTEYGCTSNHRQPRDITGESSVVE